jgi:hypothetical protein
MDILKKEYDDLHALRSQVHHAAGVFSTRLSMEVVMNHFTRKMANGLVVFS